MSFAVCSIKDYGDPGSNEVWFKTHGQASLPGVLIYGQGRGRSAVDLQIPLDEFVEAVKYVLTNTNLDEAEWAGGDDPRHEFLRWIKGLRKGRGHGGRGKRLIPEEERTAE